MKKTIAIIFGGKSTEYSVSLKSAYSVLSHMDRKKYDIYMIGISQNGEWKHFEGSLQMIENDEWYQENLHDVMVCPSPTKQCLLEVNQGHIQEVKVDAILPILHGKNGEDGTIQGMIQMSNIPLIGCDVLSSALCMDKHRAHELVKMNGIEVPHSLYLRNQKAYILKKKDILKLQLPLYIKPMKSGSSLGICRIESFDELDDAIKQAFLHDDQVLVEEEVQGFEVGCAVKGI